MLDAVRNNWMLRVAIAFTYIFLVLTSYYILKPVRESFFLGEKGYRNLPIAHLLVLAATFFALIAYTKAIRKLGTARLVTVTNIFFLACIGFFWLFLTQLDTSQGILFWLRERMAWVYYCWVSVFSVFAITLFWSVVHTVFTSERGSKCYGIIGSGATIGALTGGGITNLLAERVGTENLLLIAGAILAPCLLLGHFLARMSSVQQIGDPEIASLQKIPAPKKPRSTLTIFRNNPYLCVLGLIVMLTIVISVLDDYRYNQLIQTSLEGKDEKTAFFGNIYFYSNCIGLFFSLVLTGIVQSIWGPRPGMLLFAGLVILSGIGFLFDPSMNTVMVSAVALQSVAYSIYQWSRELLYTETTAEEIRCQRVYRHLYVPRRRRDSRTCVTWRCRNRKRRRRTAHQRGHPIKLGHDSVGNLTWCASLVDIRALSNAKSARQRSPRSRHTLETVDSTLPPLPSRGTSDSGRGRA